MKIAIVGAGIAGLACARRLTAAGHVVTVFERGDVAGGRVATMRSEIGGFDTGAQYLTARHPDFVAQVGLWLRAGLVEPWPADVASIEAKVGHPASHAPASGRTERWVGVPGMATIALAEAEGLDIRYGAAVASVLRDGAGAWSLTCAAEGEGDETVAEGPYDTVVVAVPAPAAMPLLTSALAAQAAHARIEPCWAVMAGYIEPIGMQLTAELTEDPNADRAQGLVDPGDAAFVNGGRLAWIAREASKPGRRAGERWTLHAQSGWSVEHFDDDPEDIKAKLLRAFHDATGTAEQPVYVHARRWSHALVRTSLERDHLWDVAERIGACGDWCRGHRVEDAWLSGATLAAAICAGR